MEMDKSILLQKQVRDNSEDLQREFADMRAWEEQMKRKDFEIRNLTKDNQDLPPVRNKKKKKTSPPSEEKPPEVKRIAGNDYRSWDKFDVDEACKEIDEKEGKDEEVYEIPSKEECEKEHSKATTFKEEGNALVKQKEYTKAIGKYNQAIKVFPGDAVFYANRALCHLKIDNLYSAESDCSEAIRLDSNYVKAYHRRAKARIEMKRYADAKKDIEVVLQLDPSNKDAATMLGYVQRRIDKFPKPLIIAGEEKAEKSTVEKQKVEEKLLRKETCGSSNGDLVGTNIENENVTVQEIEPSTSKEKKVIQKDSVISNAAGESKTRTGGVITIEHKGLSRAQKFLEELKNPPKPPEEAEKSEYPPWLPKLKNGLITVKPLSETSSKIRQTLKRIPVKEIPSNESIFKDVEHEAKVVQTEQKQKETKETLTVKKPEKEVNKIGEKKGKECLPPAPKSSVAFIINWRKFEFIDLKYKYLKQINPEDFPDIFKESMESNLFSDILLILSTKFIENKDAVFNYLKSFKGLKRFKMLVLFMSPEDKEALKKLLKYCKHQEERGDEEINSLYSAYEIKM